MFPRPVALGLWTDSRPGKWTRIYDRMGDPDKDTWRSAVVRRVGDYLFTSPIEVPGPNEQGRAYLRFFKREMRAAVLGGAKLVAVPDADDDDESLLKLVGQAEERPLVYISSTVEKLEVVLHRMTLRYSNR